MRNYEKENTCLRLNYQTQSTTEGQKKVIETEDDYKKQIAALNAELKQLKQQERDYEILKKQVAQQAAEYDRLADERNALERAAGNQTNELKKDV